MPVAPTQQVLGFPGMRSVSTAEFKRVFSSPSPLFLPGGRIIDGIKSRDPGNTPYTDSLRAGLIMGRVTASPNRYANSFFGTTTGALAAGGTSITVSAAQAAEIVRRIGATGNITLTGPSSANGTDTRQATVAYSAVNTTTGVVTITAPGANQVEQLDFNIAATAGNTMKLNVQKPDGTYVTTAAITYSATDVTYLGNISSALDTATGVVGGIVAGATPTVDADLSFRLTYSGTGYAGKAWAPAEVAVMPTSSTAVIYTPVTSPVQGAFVAGSLVGDTDGSQVPVLVLPDDPATPVADTLNTNGIQNIQFPRVPVAAIVDTTQVVDYPTDTGLALWIKQQINAIGNGINYIFTDGL